MIKLLTERHFEFFSLKGDCTGSSESTHVKMPLCWNSHVMAHLLSMEYGCILQYLQQEDSASTSPHANRQACDLVARRRPHLQYHKWIQDVL